MKLNKPGYRIREIFIVVFIDNDGDEGVCAVQHNGYWVPMFTSESRLVALFLNEAKHQVTVGNIKSYKLLKFSNPEQILEK